MKVCYTCGRDLSRWNLDDTRELTCDLCVQRKLIQAYPDSQMPPVSHEKPVEAQANAIGTWHLDKKWDRAKNPITWRDGLL